VPAEVIQMLRAFERPLHDSITDLRRGYQTVSECLEQTLAESDMRAAELANARRQLAESRRSLSECERQLAERTRADSELAHRCATLKKQLEAKQAELAQGGDRLAQVHAESVTAKEMLESANEHNQQLHEELKKLRSEVDFARTELAQARSQSGPSTEAAELRSQLAQAQAQIARLQQAGASRHDSSVDAALEAERSQREALESELDLLRHRGAELTESLGEQKRLWNAEREQWNEELRHLRRAVEKQAEVLAQGPGHANSSSGAFATDGEQSADKADAVLGAVRQQFEMLQRKKVRKLAPASNDGAA
jgi:chromosome segregation ATPase